MSNTGAPATIQCPNCGKQLPGWSQICQFCGASLQNVQRPADAYKYQSDTSMTWTEIAYTIVSILFILNGIWQLLQGFGVIPSIAYSLGGGTYLGIMGTVSALMGLGLLAQLDFVQFIFRLWAMLAITTWFLTLLFAPFKSEGIELAIAMTVAFFNVVFLGFSYWIVGQEGDS